jgi:MGT family glycosyltransferase
VVSVPGIAVNDRIAMGDGAPDLEFGRMIAARMPHWRASLAELNRQFGVSAISNPFELLHAYGDLNLIYTSRAFQPLAGAFEEDRFQFVGPSIPDRTPASRFPFEKIDGRPLLFISLGSVYTDRGPFFQCCAEAFAGGPWQVVMAVGQNMSPHEIGRLPENFLAEPWVPQIEILRRARLFITHGGMNSVNEALWHGVPLVVVPQGADQFWIARRVAEIGAGVSLAWTGRTPEALREAVATVAEQSSYARAAGEIGRSLREAGGAHRAADEIEAFLLQSAAR